MNWRLTIRVALSGVIGVIAWHGEMAGFLALPFLIFIWRSVEGRLGAFLCLFLYYLGAARGQLSGANLFYGSGGDAMWLGLGIWLSSSAFLAGIWAALWGSTWRAARILLILLILAVPPVGVIGWANPVTAAGMFFPSAGWLGLVGIVTMYMVIAENPHPTLFVPFIVLAIVCAAITTPLSAPAAVAGIDTQFGSAKTGEDDYRRLKTLQAAVIKRAESAPNGALILLPETVGGNWSLNQIWWNRISSRLAKRGQTALIGATKPLPAGGNVNILASVGADSGREILERVPVPVSMWRPWDRPSHFQAQWFGSGVKTIGGIKVAAIICYEQILVFPILVSMTKEPALILAPSNGWWARNTDIPATLRASISAWGRLFDVPVLFANNQ